MNDQRPRRGRPRVADIDRRIVEAAGALLRERGPAGVHIDAVATRSGVARTTIYRRYRDRRELLTATLDRVTDQGRPPAEADVPGKLRWVLERVRQVLEEGLGRGGVAAVLTDADPEFTQALRVSLTGHLDPVLRSIADDAARGVIRADVDPDSLVNLAFGAYLGELLRHREEREEWLDRTVSLLEHAVRPG
jgi:AcrR family transcriptional regulator